MLQPLSLKASSIPIDRICLANLLTAGSLLKSVILNILSIALPLTTYAPSSSLEIVNLSADGVCLYNTRLTPKFSSSSTEKSTSLTSSSLSAIWYNNWSILSLVIVETGTTVTSLSNCSLKCDKFPCESGKSILFATIICGRSSKRCL